MALARPGSGRPDELEMHAVLDGQSPMWRWNGPVPGGLLPLSPSTATALQYSLRAALDAHRRLNQAAGEMRAGPAWAAAVESTWWLAAIEEQLCDLFRPSGIRPGDLPRLGGEWGRERWDRYRQLRRQDPDGQAMDGLRWLRHRHAHELAMTGQGSARSFFGPHDDPDALFYISAGYTWRPVEDVPHDADGDLQPHLRPLYDRHVARRPLDDPLLQVIWWLGRLCEALGLDYMTEGVHRPGDPRDLP